MASIVVVPGIDQPVKVELAPKDRPILATVIKERCDFLLTGDKRDFGRLFGCAVEGVTVLTPLLLAKRLKRAEES